MVEFRGQGRLLRPRHHNGGKRVLRITWKEVEILEKIVLEIRQVQ